ncbi:hypothetical protein AM593_01041, partial [Mytilus galloprovincialis]
MYTKHEQIEQVDVSAMKYIYYKQLNRYCVPYYDCEPDNEIQPCTMNSTRDICSPCVKGMVQPDLISSPENGDTSATACFKPTTDCLAQEPLEGLLYLTVIVSCVDAYDKKLSLMAQKTRTGRKNITSKRIVVEGFCDSLHGCKCKITACFYGDPCLCNEKRYGCPPGTTLNEAGECVPCPNGTYKNGNGCGPCRHLQSNHIASPSTQNTRIVTTYISLPSPTLHQSDTSGYETQFNDETLPSTFSASGDYMSMNVSRFCQYFL